MHLSPEFGLTVRAIESDGFPISERVEMLLSSDSPEGIAKSIGLGTIGFAQAFGRFCPDILVVLGDRFEMYAAAVAALPFKIPIAHIHGGEITLGAMDDALRHSMTKLSHLHFTSTREYARRLRQMGEEPWRITVSGAPGLDNIPAIRLFSPEELESRYHLHLHPPPLLVTFHPVTLEYERADWQLGELLAALEECDIPVIFTMPNADTGGRLMMQKIETFIRTRSWAQKVDNFGSQGYFSLMAIAMAMVGNSSSGIIEAPSFGLPFVNIGTRQIGRVKAANVIDVGYERTEIIKGIHQALRPEFRANLRRMSNPYSLGRASEIIVSKLRDVTLDDRLLLKRFHDLDITAVDEG